MTNSISSGSVDIGVVEPFEQIIAELSFWALF